MLSSAMMRATACIVFPAFCRSRCAWSRPACFCFSKAAGAAAAGGTMSVDDAAGSGASTGIGAATSSKQGLWGCTPANFCMQDVFMMSPAVDENPFKMQ